MYFWYLPTTAITKDLGKNTHIYFFFKITHHIWTWNKMQLYMFLKLHTITITQRFYETFTYMFLKSPTAAIIKVYRLQFLPLVKIIIWTLLWYKRQYDVQDNIMMLTILICKPHYWYLFITKLAARRKYLEIILVIKVNGRIVCLYRHKRSSK